MTSFFEFLFSESFFTGLEHLTVEDRNLVKSLVKKAFVTGQMSVLNKIADDVTEDDDE
jgi:hypothetical protein